MNILAIDTTGQTSSCALISEKNGQPQIIAESTINTGLTHSQTIMPLISDMLHNAGFDKSNLHYIAASSGPGSFTGLRIGAATAKGLAAGLGIKIVPVSTLDALAYNMIIEDATIVPIMDARRGQVYAALYVREGGGLRRLSEYLAEDMQAVIELVKAEGRSAVFLGDGVAVHEAAIAEHPKFTIAPCGFNLQRAALVGLIAAQNIGDAVSPADFEPCYIRKSQAERERDERLCK